MATTKQTVGAFMASFFGKSEKVISEKLTTDEHNQFTTEATELQTKITNLESEKTTLQASVTQLEGEKTTLASEKATLETAKTTLEGEKTTLQGQLTTAETDRDKYKAWFEKQAGVGAELPKLDESSKDGPKLTSYNQHALDVFRQSKGL